MSGLAELLTFVTTDYAGITRGRAVPLQGWEPGQRRSVGWVPAAMSLTPFDVIADPNPWGAAGDLRLLGDDAARYRTALPGAATPFDVIISDIVGLDGTPWPLCPRGFLKAALADLTREAGVMLHASFAHEFQVLGADWPAAPASSLRSLRRADPFGPGVIAALEEAGLAPETFAAGDGRDQYGVTIAPAPGLTAADRAVVLRELVRETAARRGWRASFAPKTTLDSGGNGVHIHFSLNDMQGRPATHDPVWPGGVSVLAGSFVAGILRHLPALTAFTVPSVISGLRLHRDGRSSSYSWFAEGDRQASLRISPVNRITGADPARAYNIEYRAADATACPHLALGVIVRAGLAGISAGLPTPPLFSGDPDRLEPHERKRLGLHALPQTLEEGLAAFLADDVVTRWFDPRAIETYVGMKRLESQLAGPLLDDALCARYAAIY